MKMLMSSSALVLLTSAFVAGQRPSFAGTRPIGFPDTPNRTTTTPDPLGNRFGAPDKLPLEANGDRDLIDRLSKLPLDKQPFWFINWQALEEHRKNPQTYPQRPNVFVDPVTKKTNTGMVDNRFSTPDPGFISTNAASVLINRILPTTISNQVNSDSSNSNPGLGNRNGDFVETTGFYVNQNTGSTNKHPQLQTNTHYPKINGHEYF